MTTTLSRRARGAHRSKCTVYAYDTHGDVIADEVDEEQGANARPSSFEQLAFSRHLASSWSSR